MELEIGKYRMKDKDGWVFEYWVNEIFKKTAHVDCILRRPDRESSSHSFDKRYPLWLIKQRIQECEKFE